DVAGYRKYVAAMLDRFGDDDPSVARELAFASVRVPGAAGDPARLLRLADRAAEEAKTGDDFERAEGLVVLAAALVRVGLAEAALPRLLEAEKARAKEPSALDAFFLALTYQRLGQTGKAKEALARGVRLTEEAAKKGELNWEQRLNRRVLREEAE